MLSDIWPNYPEVYRTVCNVGHHYFCLLSGAVVVVYTICFIGIPSERRLMFTDGPYSDLVQLDLLHRLYLD